MDFFPVDASTARTFRARGWASAGGLALVLLVSLGASFERTIPFAEPPTAPAPAEPPPPAATALHARRRAELDSPTGDVATASRRRPTKQIPSTGRQIRQRFQTGCKFHARQARGHQRRGHEFAEFEPVLAASDRPLPRAGRHRVRPNSSIQRAAPTGPSTPSVNIRQFAARHPRAPRLRTGNRNSFSEKICSPCRFERRESPARVPCRISQSFRWSCFLFS